MRVAFFTDVYRPTTNGVVRSIDLFVDELRALGHEVRIVCPRYPDYKVEDDRDVYRVRSSEFKGYKEYRLASMLSPSVDRMMRKWRPDLIHIHSPFTIGTLGQWYGRTLRRPVIYTAHTDYSEYLHYAPRFTQRLLRSSSIDKLSARYSNTVACTIAPSQKIESKLREYGTKTPIVQLQTGVPDSLLDGADPQIFRKKWNISADATMLLYVGRISKEKNVVSLVDVLRRIVVIRPDTSLVLVGDGPLRDEVFSYATSLGIAEKLVITGYLEGRDLASAYVAGDVFLYMSSSETQGMAPLEAAFAGMPLALEKDESYDYIADNGANALFGDSPTQLADKIIELVESKTQLDRYSHASRSRAEEFTMDKQANKLVDIYNSVLSKYARGIDDIVGEVIDKSFTQHCVEIYSEATYYIESDDYDESLPTLVCLHGFLSDGRSMIPMLAALNYRGRIIVPDIPGFGMSPPLKPGEQQGIDDLTDWLSSFLKTVKNEDEVIIAIGYSFGSSILLSMQSRGIDVDIEQYILITPALKIQAQADIYTTNFLRIARISKRLAENMWKWQYDFATLYLSKNSKIKIKLQLMKYRREEIKQFEPLVVKRLFEDIRKQNIEDYAMGMSRPIAVIRAGKDNLASNHAYEEFNKKLEHKAEEIHLPYAGHLALMEEPEVVSGAVSRFLQNLDNIPSDNQV